jgi:cytochrome c oxidase subunit II
MMAPFQHMLEVAGPQAGRIAQLWWFFVVLCALVFVAIWVALLIALWRAPRGDGSTPPDAEAMFRPERGARLAVTWGLALAVVGLFALTISSVATDRALAQLPLQQAVNIEVTGNQWWWNVLYDDADPTKLFSTANEIVVPVGRPVLVKLRANDVIHSFWVPNLAGKKDLIPGHETTLAFQADKPGTYRGQCAEFCGLQHAYMAFEVKAVSADEFARWQEAQRKPAAEPADDRQKRGRELFVSGTCQMCHAIQGTTANAHRAPDLTHVASRRTLAAGRLKNTPENLAAWIRDPQQFKPGVNMPAHVIGQQDLDALVAYLGALK